jgi:hypothetical protein
VIPFRRASRHTDRWASSHERGRTLAAARMDAELSPDDAAWLEAHLEACAGCRTVERAYHEGRDLLRGLRGTEPPPPRDLWARTAAAIEAESRGRRRRSRAGSPLGIPVGALAGVLVIAVVMGASLVSNLPPTPNAAPEIAATAEPRTALDTPEPTSEPTSIATPIVVGDNEVKLIRLGGQGDYDFSVARFDRVCTSESRHDCPTIEESVASAIAVDATPRSVIGSPGEDQAVVVGAANGAKATDVYVVALPTEEDTGGSTSVPDPTATAAPSASPSPTDSPSDLPTIAPTTDPTTAPTTSPDPQPTPESILIAQDLIVVGQTAAYSEDGSAFAFTARPADGSHGSDIYVWTVGDDKARPVTWDHRSVFASWSDDDLIGSRPMTEPAVDSESDVRSFVLDPATGQETHLDGAGWLPVVDPTGRFAVTWSGTVTLDGDGEIVPATGAFELRTWADDAPEDGTSGVVIAEGTTQVDVRWDESGTAFAMWIEDVADGRIGRLTLHFVDPVTGLLRQAPAAPRDVPALPGFVIGEGRLAWGSPPGQGGEGSRVLAVAWNGVGVDVGIVESAPGGEVVLVR